MFERFSRGIRHYSSDQYDVPPETFTQAERLFSSLQSACDGIELPFFYPIGDGRLYLTWDTAEYHLEAIVADSPYVEWYGSDGTLAGAWAKRSPAFRVPRGARRFLKLIFGA